SPTKEAATQQAADTAKQVFEEVEQPLDIQPLAQSSVMAQPDPANAPIVPNPEPSAFQPMPNSVPANLTGNGMIMPPGATARAAGAAAVSPPASISPAATTLNDGGRHD